MSASAARPFIAVEPVAVDSAPVKSAPVTIAGIAEIRIGLLAAARKEAAEIVSRARSEGEAIQAAAVKSAQKESDSIELRRLVRLNSLRNEFLQQTIGGILSLIEAAVTAVTGDLYSEPAIAAKTAQALRHRISQIAGAYLRGKPLRVVLDPEDLSSLYQDGSRPNEEQNNPAGGLYPLLDSVQFSTDCGIGRGNGRIITEFGAIEVKLRDQIEAAFAEIRRGEQIRSALIDFLESEDA